MSWKVSSSTLTTFPYLLLSLGTITLPTLGTQEVGGGSGVRRLYLYSTDPLHNLIEEE